MTTLITGASGATGRLVVEQLLDRGQKVRVIVRVPNSLPETIMKHPNLFVIPASVLELADAEMLEYVIGCDAVVSCLGHNMTFKGMFGQPRSLVTDATRRLCDAIKTSKPENAVKFVLMNTTGNTNRDLAEKVSFWHNCVIWLLRHLLPPHADNENAADYLRTNIGQSNPAIQWVAVRPDALIDVSEISQYDVHTSPIRDAIFDSGKTSRINVAHFMAELLTDEVLWKQWKGKMPVIYNRE